MGRQLGVDRAMAVAERLEVGSPEGAPRSSDAPIEEGSVPWPARLTGRWATVVAFVVMALSVLATFVFIHRYAVDMLYSDQLMDGLLVDHALHGTLTFGQLWAQHNENRILVPNLVVVLLGYATHLDSVVEDFLSGIALCGATVLLVLAHRRRTPGAPWLLYCPAVLVLLSYVVVADALFGFNLSWFLVLAAFAGTLHLADRPKLSWLVLAGAVAVGVLGSLSSLQGLFIWPAILVLLWLRRRQARLLVAWVAAAIVTTVVYFVGFDFSQAGVTVQLGPGARLSFLVAEVGNVFGSRSTVGDDHVIGLTVLVLATVALVVGCRRRRQDGAAVGVAMIVFGLAFTASAALGRAQLGLNDALRYAPFVLMVWVGTYFVFATWLTDRLRAHAGNGGGARDHREGDPGWRRRAPAVLFAALVGLMGIQVQAAKQQSTDNSRAWHDAELTVANVSANIEWAPDVVVADTMGGYAVPLTRHLVAVARADRLSLFGTALAAQEMQQGLDPHLLTHVLRPAAGQHLRGTVTLDASVASARPATVEFQILGGGKGVRTITGATQTLYGYLARWDTATVPNGNYYLRSRTTLPGGVAHVGHWIEVAVENSR
jgi:hypothetical protein